MMRKRQIEQRLRALRESPSRGVSDEIRISQLEKELDTFALVDLKSKRKDNGVMQTRRSL